LLKAEHRLTLTGTPIENGTAELWSQFAFLNPGLLGGIEVFKENFLAPIERGKDENAASALRALTRPFLLRRTKAQVATDLPPRTERIITVELEAPQRKLYEQTRDKYRAQILGILDSEGSSNAQLRVLEGLLRLRQICCDPRLMEPTTKVGSAKLEAILETMETLRAEGHKALIFSQFTQMLGLLKNELDAKSVPYLYLDGRTKDRQGRVDQFQARLCLQVPRPRHGGREDRLATGEEKGSRGLDHPDRAEPLQVPHPRRHLGAVFITGSSGRDLSSSRIGRSW
jgi:non-specific serine/threonine protein kinase